MPRLPPTQPAGLWGLRFGQNGSFLHPNCLLMTCSDCSPLEEKQRSGADADIFCVQYKHIADGPRRAADHDALAVPQSTSKDIVSARKESMSWVSNLLFERIEPDECGRVRDGFTYRPPVASTSILGYPKFLHHPMAKNSHKPARTSQHRPGQTNNSLEPHATAGVHATLLVLTANAEKPASDEARLVRPIRSSPDGD